MSNIAIITARGGSKGFPGKNIATLHGKPLIAWSIEAAINSCHVDDVYVTTDDNVISAVSIKHGAKVINRPAEISGDKATSDEAIAHAIEELERLNIAPTVITLLQPTSPLRDATHIDKAISLFNTKHNGVVMSGYEPEICIPKLYEVCSDSFLRPVIGPNGSFMRRQDAPRYFYPNGAIYVFKVSDFKKDMLIPRNQIVPFYMTKTESVDIDTKEDLARCEEILK